MIYNHADRTFIINGKIYREDEVVAAMNTDGFDPFNFEVGKPWSFPKDIDDRWSPIQPKPIKDINDIIRRLNGTLVDEEEYEIVDEDTIEDLEKEIKSLKRKNQRLRKKNKDLNKELDEVKKRSDPQPIEAGPRPIDLE